MIIILLAGVLAPEATTAPQVLLIHSNAQLEDSVLQKTTLKLTTAMRVLKGTIARRLALMQ